MSPPGGPPLVRTDESQEREARSLPSGEPGLIRKKFFHMGRLRKVRKVEAPEGYTLEVYS